MEMSSEDPGKDPNNPADKGINHSDGELQENSAKSSVGKKVSKQVNASKKKARRELIWMASIGCVSALMLLLIFFFVSKEDKIYVANQTDVKTPKLSFKKKNSILEPEKEEVPVDKSDLFVYFFRKANQSYIELNYDEALTFLEKPTSVELSDEQKYLSNTLISAIYLANDTPELAVNSLAKAREHRNTPFLSFFSGVVALENGDKDLSHKFFNSALSQDSSYRPALEILGDHAMVDRDFNQAVNYYRKAERETYSVPATKIKLSLLDFYQNKFEESVSTISEIRGVERNRHLSFIYFLEAMNNFQLGKFDESFANFEKAVGSASTKNRVFYLYYWGRVAMLRGDWLKAWSVINQALLIADPKNPYYVASLLELSYVSFRIKKYQKTIEYIQKLREIDKGLVTGQSELYACGCQSGSGQRRCCGKYFW